MRSMEAAISSEAAADCSEDWAIRESWASKRSTSIRIDWTASDLVIEIHDDGPGFPPEVLEHGGFASFPAHQQGSGIGLMLTRSAIEQLGGQLTLCNPSQGGALARIDLAQVTP